MLKSNESLSRGEVARRIIAMIKDRGFSKIVSISKKSNYAFIGTEQTQEDHPRPNGSLIATYLSSDKYSKDLVKMGLVTLQSAALQKKCHDSSSLILIYAFPISKARLEEIENIYADLSANSKSFYLEMIHVSLFYETRFLPRSTRNWRLVRKELTELMIGNDGTPILVDKPCMILLDDPINQYYGGRVGDRYEFERLTVGEVGEMWVPDMREVSAETRERKKKKDEQI